MCARSIRPAPEDDMPRYWPPPEEFERQRKRWEAWRVWALPVAAGLALAILALLAWEIAGALG